MQNRTTWNKLKRPATSWNDLRRARNDLKWPEAVDNKQETTWNGLQRPETTYNKQETTYNDLKVPTTTRFWDYFTIWGNPFYSPARFPPKTWLQSFEHCFMENHNGNRGLNIYILSCVIFTGCKICRICCKPLGHLQINI